MPKLETVNQMTIKQWREFIQDELELMLTRHSRNCLNCVNFRHGEQNCSLNDQMPPPKIAVKGCEYWDEEIPF